MPTKTLRVAAPARLATAQQIDATLEQQLDEILKAFLEGTQKA